MSVEAIHFREFRFDEMISVWTGFGMHVLINIMPKERQLQPEDQYVAVVVTVPEDRFQDDDEICLEAATYVCLRLEDHLLKEGHDVQDWIKGGCSEDWGVYYETLLAGDRYEYNIMFFPEEKESEQRSIMVRYLQKQGFLTSLFSKLSGLADEHPLHASMESFGKLFESHKMLSQSQLDRQY
ncbi:hypothetical protein [Gimesia aquarii]|uniref:Uncharacterized protein n=1 Tax=Gimesia aquarii TaxID=2527964 RepID=A0A517W3U1_9PLAN|nr:hypothetical protein [Gimesia aquarii]QDT99918.1 hypothetical protein V144x_54320 [Gimesia aquarii]